MNDIELERLRKSHEELRASHEKLKGYFVLLVLAFAVVSWYLYDRKNITVDELTVREGIYVDDPDNPGWQERPGGGKVRSPLVYIGHEDGSPLIYLGEEDKYIQLGVDMDHDRVDSALNNHDFERLVKENPYYSYISFFDYSKERPDTKDYGEHLKNVTVYTIAPQRPKEADDGSK